MKLTKMASRPKSREKWFTKLPKTRQPRPCGFESGPPDVPAIALATVFGIVGGARIWGGIVACMDDGPFGEFFTSNQRIAVSHKVVNSCLVGSILVFIVWFSCGRNCPSTLKPDENANELQVFSRSRQKLCPSPPSIPKARAGARGLLEKDIACLLIIP